MTHGYARCSTSEDRQDINRQTRELKKQGVEKVWLEFEHGDTASKEQQRLMLNAAKPGDTILTLEAWKSILQDGTNSRGIQQRVEHNLRKRTFRI